MIFRIEYEDINESNEYARISILLRFKLINVHEEQEKEDIETERLARSIYKDDPESLKGLGYK